MHCQHLKQFSHPAVKSFGPNPRLQLEFRSVQEVGTRKGTLGLPACDEDNGKLSLCWKFGHLVVRFMVLS